MAAAGRRLPSCARVLPGLGRERAFWRMKPAESKGPVPDRAAPHIGQYSRNAPVTLGANRMPKGGVCAALFASGEARKT